jgi:hypothetical protein
MTADDETHALPEIRSRCLDDAVMMHVQQAGAVDDPASRAGDVMEALEIRATVGVVENDPPPTALGNDVVDGAGFLDPQSPTHVTRMNVVRNDYKSTFRDDPE